MLNLKYYYKKTDINQTEFAASLVKRCKDGEMGLVEICVDDHSELAQEFENRTPAISVGPYMVSWPFSELDLTVAINSARERHSTQSESDRNESNERLARSTKFSGLDKFSLFFSKYYAIVISIALTFFVMLPFLAPILEENGKTGPANIIYKVYSVFCHQLTFRSFFLFGEQPFYPRELAGISGEMTYESAIGQPAGDLIFAKNFTGNVELGYKVALCERDVALYGSLGLFGLIFTASKKRIKKIPWYIWFIFALVPIAIDGFSQIPGLAQGWPSWLPVRESTPFLRVLTGTLFGAGTGWYMFPLMEETFADTRILLLRKQAILNNTSLKK
jgi:uncharacterized membrane protein